MYNRLFNTLLASIFLISHISFSQTDPDIVELDEIILSLPFNQDRGKSVIKVNKINLNSINPILKSYISKSISKLPGISLITTGPGIAKPSIRGLSASRVIIYSQGIRLENHQWGDEHGVGVSTSGISSVELIKGPAYVLYGSDAMGGVLYIEPERYSSDFSVDYMGIYNSNYSGITNNIGVKGSSNNFSYVLRGNMTDNQNFSSPGGEVENTWLIENDIQAGLKYQTENFASDLRLSTNISELGIPDPDIEQGQKGSYQELSHTMLTWKNNIDLGNNHELEATLGRQFNERKEFSGLGGNLAELDMELTTNTIDVNLTMPQTENFNMILGTNILSQENKNFGLEKLIPDADMNDFGLYGLGQITMENGSALIGVRYDSRSITSEKGSVDFSNFNGSIGLKRDIGNSSLRLNLGSGYRAPNLIELFADGIHHGTFRYEKGNPNLEAETSFQSEISLDIMNDDSNLAFDVFYNDISNYIYVAPSSEAIDGYKVYNFLQQNATLWGSEIIYTKQTGIEWLSSNTSLEYINGKTAEGDPLPFIAPLTFKQVFNLDFSENYSLEIDFVAKAKQSRISQFEEETDGYSLLNLSGNWKTSFLDNDLDIFWSVDNVFDKEYFDHLSRLKEAGIHEMGRNISIGLKYNF
jgi:iron complex outermembrane receptor protein